MARMLVLIVLIALRAVTQTTPPATQPAAPEHARSKEYNRALGVECTHCHVEGNYADASKPVFDFASRMARMTKGLSEGPLKDLGGVTCWSCHRGRVTPARLPRDAWDPIAKAHAADFAGGRPNLDLSMAVYSASLGVQCSHCHVDGDWKDGSRRGYRLAGRMAQMFDLIPAYFEGSARRPSTQCFMCHHGTVHVERD